MHTQVQEYSLDGKMDCGWAIGLQGGDGGDVLMCKTFGDNVQTRRLGGAIDYVLYYYIEYIYIYPNIYIAMSVLYPNKYDIT